MSAAASAQREQGRPHKQGEAKERSSRLRVRATADSIDTTRRRGVAEAAPQGASPREFAEADNSMKR